MQESVGVFIIYKKKKQKIKAKIFQYIPVITVKKQKKSKQKTPQKDRYNFLIFVPYFFFNIMILHFEMMEHGVKFLFWTGRG